jgi:predicted porin
MFGRQAFVGLSVARLVTLTAGRRYDMFWTEVIDRQTRLVTMTFAGMD